MDFKRALDDTTTDAAIAEDEKEAAAQGVKMTPALVMVNNEGDRIVIEGLRDTELIRRAIQVLRTDQAVADAARERVTATTFIPEGPVAERYTPSSGVVDD